MGTVGKVLPHTEVKIVDENDQIVALDQPGELCVRGYNVMLGYWGEGSPGRWMHTGDIATMDEAGYVRIVGRSKDMLIRGGENIYPREIEEFLFTHPKIQDAKVIGVPDERFGEEVCAWVQLKEGETLAEDEIRAFCKQNIAYFKVPRYIRLVEEFPMTVTGKIQKFKMRETMVKELQAEDAA